MEAIIPDGDVTPLLAVAVGPGSVALGASSPSLPRTGSATKDLPSRVGYQIRDNRSCAAQEDNSA